MALVFRDIIDAKRDRPPPGHSGEVVLIDLFRLPAPGTPVVPKLTDQFLLLCIDTDNWPPSRNEALLLGGRCI